MSGDNPFEELARWAEEAHRSLKQLSAGGGWRRTVIVHPQLGRDAAEANRLAGDWKAREERQLMDNVSGILG